MARLFLFGDGTAYSYFLKLITYLSGSLVNPDTNRNKKKKKKKKVQVQQVAAAQRRTVITIELILTKGGEGFRY